MDPNHLSRPTGGPARRESDILTGKESLLQTEEVVGKGLSWLFDHEKRGKRQKTELFSLPRAGGRMEEHLQRRTQSTLSDRATLGTGV